MKVGDEFRINRLSLKEGGVTVCIEKVNGKILEYDKVKYPRKFIDKAMQDSQNIRAWIKKS